MKNLTENPIKILLSALVILLVVSGGFYFSKSFKASNSSTLNLPSPIPVASPKTVQNASPSSQLKTGLVNVSVQIPKKESSFEIEIKDGMNVCEIMQMAKTEEKIKSITFDDKYLKTFKSLLITEINGVKGSWVFEVNGKSPDGCSLSFPLPNDKIVFKSV